MVAGRSWPARPAGFVLSDLDRKADELRIDLTDLERYRDRIIEAIQTKRARTAEGGTIALDEFTGIDILGNMLEASVLSPDLNYYGDMHNLGHVVISYCHDPDHRFLVRMIWKKEKMIEMSYGEIDFSGVIWRHGRFNHRHEGSYFLQVARVC